MVIYNPKDWIKLIFQWHRSDTLRVLLPAILTIAFLSAIIVYAENYLWDLHLQNTNILHTILGFVLSMVLVFRVNSAYDRWWEGRKLWGEMVNSTRNLAIKLNSFLDGKDYENRKLFCDLIGDYPIASKQHLRKEWLENEYADSKNIYSSNFINCTHRPNFIASKIFEKLEELKRDKKLTENQLLLINQDVSNLTNIVGGCERIKSTPIPYSYSLFLKKIIAIYVFSMPFCFALQFGYWTIGITIVVFYAFASIELIAEEIEDPFGTDDNDLPIDELSEKIRTQTRDILNPNY